MGISDEDRALFRASVADVRPQTPDRVSPPPRRPAPLPRQRQADDRAVLESLADPDFSDELETGEELQFLRAGLQYTVLRRLRRGKYTVSGELDLHGFDVQRARDTLARFLNRRAPGQASCVRIIHGKGRGSPDGRPVLKEKVNGWLRRRQEVMAFCSARPVDGGTGALYVLLRGR